MLAVHYAKPDTYPFYDVEHGMKKGGKKRKSKKPTEAQNVNKININIGKGSAYRAITSRKQMIAPARAMANPPAPQLMSTYAVPNSSTFFRPPPQSVPDHGVPLAPGNTPLPKGRRLADGALVDTVLTPNPHSVPTYIVNENQQGITPVDSNAKRIIPTPYRGNHGGVFEQDPIRATADAEEVADSILLSGNPSYFQPTGRGNTPAPHQAQATFASQVDRLNPIGAQPAVPVNEEIHRLREDIRNKADWRTYKYQNTDHAPGEYGTILLPPTSGRMVASASNLTNAFRDPYELALGGEGRGPQIPSHLLVRGLHARHGPGMTTAQAASLEVDAKEDPVDAKRRGGRKHKSVFH